ncbi:MAG: hypothetical protein O7E52_11135 [Candidatus Poribacteria bacterium]|nr:hypothetical protein [Candidatus Poribacteria bacterium]
MAEATIPLTIPENFNPQTCMLGRWEEGRTFHASRLAAEFAADLVANGTPQYLDLAEDVLEAVLQCQERREGDPHMGNFLWEREDEAVEAIGLRGIPKVTGGQLNT